MVWYEKVILAVVVILATAAFVNILTPVGPDLPYGIMAAVLGIIGAVLILRRRRDASGQDS